MFKNNVKNTHLEQLNDKLVKFSKINKTTQNKLWIKSSRLALGMSARQLGERLGISAQAVINMEKRERDGSINISTLKSAALAMGLDFVYGFAKRELDLMEIINNAALKKAEKVVLRTDRDMFLEDQAISKRQIRRSIKNNAKKIAEGSKRILWD